MKLKILLVSAYLLLSTTAFAKLSDISSYRISQGIVHCKEANNEIIYKDYWKDSIEPKNLSAVCMVEQFADQVAADGDEWLETEAFGLMKQCRARSPNRERFFVCLKKKLDKIVHEFSNPCVELEAENIWDEDECRRLVHYVFMKKFKPIHDANMSLIYDNVKISPELSLTNTWRIKQAVSQCEQSNNELMYGNYWRGSVKPENKENICIVEKFADQVASEGDTWLKEEAEKVIKQCEKQGRKLRAKYYSCLEKSLAVNARKVSLPCKEIGEKKLWSAAECESLVSYIFMTKFEKVIESRKSSFGRFKPSLDRMSQITWVKYLVNPIVAILVFVFFVLDVVFLIEKGTWMRVSKLGVITGFLLLIACFTKNGIRFLFSGSSIVMTLLFIAWNHRPVNKKPKRKGPTPIEF